MKEVFGSVLAPVVVLVDSDEFLLGYTKGLLEAGGCCVKDFPRAESAFAVCLEEKVDVVLADVQLLGSMDGLELCVRIREHEALCYLPVVLMSAFAHPAMRKEGYQIGADEFIARPFVQQELLERVLSQAARSRHLRKAMEVRQEAFRRRVIATLSHEFRTPLVAVITATELLQRELGAIDASNLDRIERLLGAMQRGGSRLGQLVDDFMVMQQLDEGKLNTKYESRVACHAASQLLRSIELAHKDRLLEQGYELTVVLEGEDFELDAYDACLLGVLDRLLSNAVKFSDKGKTVLIVAQRLEAEAVFEVVDEGLGIDINLVEQMKLPFGQIDREKYEQQGAGLGLSIAEHLARATNGRLEFRRAPNGGTCARVVLPLKQAKRVESKTGRHHRRSYEDTTCDCLPRTTPVAEAE